MPSSLIDFGNIIEEWLPEIYLIYFKQNAMFFTGISIAFVIMVIAIIFIYRHFYLKKKARQKQDEQSNINHD